MGTIAFRSPRWGALTPDTRLALDLVDLYFILRYEKLESLFAVAARKYSRVRSFAASATRALAYFEDAEALPMPRMIDSTPWEAMKSDLEKQAMESGRKHLADLWD